MRVAIVTDSTADIPADLAAKLHISIISSILIIEGREYEDGRGISREEFYAKLSSFRESPTTAAPSAGAFEQVYRNLLGEGADQLLSIHLPKNLSGTYNAACTASLQFEDKVRVVDSGQLSLGLGFQAMAAAEAAAQGADMEETIAAAEGVRRRVRVVAMLETLEQLRRSGRVSWAQAGVGTLFQFKPFVELKEGEVLRLGNVRTRRKGIGRLAEMLNAMGRLERLAILHTNAEEEARHIAETIDTPVATQPLVVNVTTVIGTHVGARGLGFAAVKSKP